jgi:hypothetical protein
VWLAAAILVERRHEPWADEAQAWLLARDLPISALWMRELRYEGSPGLWHTILFAAQHVFHPGYGAIGFIGLFFAALGAAFMLWRAPFPRPLRYLLLFSFFIAYQYAIVARPYTLIPLLAFVAASCFRDVERPWKITVALLLLSLVTAHGALLAACLGIGYLAQAAGNWSKFGGRVRAQYVLCISALLIDFLFLYAILRPSADVEKIAEMAAVGWAVKLQHAWAGLQGALVEQPLLCVAFLLITGFWTVLRHKWLTYLPPVLLLALFYGMVGGWPHQQGTIFIAAIAGLWIAWPVLRQPAVESPLQALSLKMVSTAFALLLGYHALCGIGAMRDDYLGPYSGAEDAARYLRPAVESHATIYGYGYALVAVQGYFDRNVLANWPAAYYHHTATNPALDIDRSMVALNRPGYIVLPCWYSPCVVVQNYGEPLLNQLGYERVHLSQGYIYGKLGVVQPQHYFIYRRR